jgi:hypothetical protein
MHTAGVILVILAGILLFPMFVTVCHIISEWIMDAFRGELLDEYSFYWFGVLFAIVFLIAGLVLIAESTDDADEQKHLEVKQDAIIWPVPQ